MTLAAAQGDATARHILHEAGKELALCVNAVIKRLCMEHEPVTVGTVGGVFRAGRAVLRSFRERVKQVAPQASIMSARVPTAVGAVLMALESIDVPVHDELLLNVESALPRLGPMKT